MATDSIAASPRVVKAERKDTSVEVWLVGASGPRHVTHVLFDALREYFTRPKVLTPRERAEQMVRSFARSYGGFDPVPGHVWINLTDSVAAAIEDAARRGVDWEE